VAIPAGPSQALSVVYPGAAGILTRTRDVALRVPASATIHASATRLFGAGTVRFSGRLGTLGTALPPGGKIVDLQAAQGGRWTTVDTARAIRLERVVARRRPLPRQPGPLPDPPAHPPRSALPVRARLLALRGSTDRVSGSRRLFELSLGASTLLPIPIFVVFVAVLVAAPPADGEFPIVPAVLMLLWTLVNFVPAIVLAVDANQDRSLSDSQRTTWTIMIVILGGLITPVYFWAHRWPRVTRS
jgi:hypothetical protein